MPEPPPPPSQKELRTGRYVLLQPLGHGAQGTTWDAVDKREGRPVAVKAFDVRGASSWKDVELAEREARILSELDHPLLPHYIEHFEEDGVLYLVMEKVHGTPLSVLQKQASRMSEKDVVRFLHDADRTLSYLHSRNPPIIHRDLKPGNVIRRADGAYALVDFGAVKDHLRPEGGSTVVGTFGYMAPEQFQGRASPASDVYGAGATAIALLTGKEPEKLPHRGLTIDVAAALGTSVSPRLVAALVRMVDSNPDTRASRIGPLLDSVGGERVKEDRSSRDDPDRPWNVGRRAAKQARKEARRVQREARAHARSARHHHGEVPFVFRAVGLIGLAYAQVWVALMLQAFVPALLTLLSVVFGRPLRDAARRVSDAGARAVARIAEKQRQLNGTHDDDTKREEKNEHGYPVERGVRVPTQEPRVRVESRGAPEREGAEEQLDDESEPSAKQRQRRV